MSLRRLVEALEGREFILAVVLAVLLSGLTQWKLANDRSNARSAYIKEQQALAQDLRNQIEGNMTRFYQGLRTVSRLPGVRTVDRYADNLDYNTRTSVQELYGYLHQDLGLSAMCLVPPEFEPDEDDPNTGRPQEPIIVFDQRIVDRTVLGLEEQTGIEVEKIEIYQYRLMKEQWVVLSEASPVLPMSDELEAIPAVAGREVVTSDNTLYNPKKPDEKDRSGMVYSVPFYWPDGQIGGMVSGVVLTHRIRQWLGKAVSQGPLSPTYALRIRPDYEVSVGEVSASDLNRIRDREPDPDVIYSDVLPLEDVQDLGGQWTLWVRTPDEAFYARPEVAALRTLGLTAHLGAWLLCLALGAVLRQSTRLGIHLRRQIDDLVEQTRPASEGDLTAEIAGDGEVAPIAAALTHMLASLRGMVLQVMELGDAVSSITEDIAATAREQETMATETAATTMETVASVREISSAATQVAETMENLRRSAEKARGLANEGQSALANIQGGILTLGEEAEALRDELVGVAAKVEGIRVVLSTIVRVADQTNLLSLSGAIEAEKAGEAGQGFAVVARETRHLADQTAAATQGIIATVTEIRSSIRSSVEHVERYVELVNHEVSRAEEGSSLIGAAIGRVISVSKNVEEVSGAIQQQSESAAQIREALVQLGDVSQQVAGSVEASTAAIEGLREKTVEMYRYVARFKVDERGEQ